MEHFMENQYSAIPCWSTTANNQRVDSFLIDSSVLREHLHHCRKPYGRFYTVVCAADAMHGFVVSRFVTTIFVIAALIVVSSLVL
jgi:hypothetical protein